MNIDTLYRYRLIIDFELHPALNFICKFTFKVRLYKMPSLALYKHYKKA